MQEQPSTVPNAAPPSAPAAAPVEPPAPDPSAPPTAAAPASPGIEDEIREKGEKIEAAAKDLGRQLDQKIESNETARAAKQKVGGFWNKLKETIK